MENEVKEPGPKLNYISPEEYLAMERASQEKHEYYNGEVFAMSGASWNHNVIAKNISTVVLPYLKGKPCDMFGSDLRIHIPENGLYTYPDFSIICDKPESTDAEKDPFVNPTAIIEILSKSTADYDRGTKFNLYREIPTFKEYVLVDSTRISVEHFEREPDNSWRLTEFKTLNNQFLVTTIGLTLSLADLYEDVRFEP